MIVRKIDSGNLRDDVFLVRRLGYLSLLLTT